MADEQGVRRGAVVIGAVIAVVVVAVVAWLALRDDDPPEPEAFDSACGTVVRPPADTDTTVLFAYPLQPCKARSTEPPMVCSRYRSMEAPEAARRAVATMAECANRWWRATRRSRS